MSALALCLMQIEQQLNPDISKEFFNKKASFLARLGSGSACRSIEGDLIVWGAHSNIKGSSDVSRELSTHMMFIKILKTTAIQFC